MSLRILFKPVPRWISPNARGIGRAVMQDKERARPSRFQDAVIKSRLFPFRQHPWRLVFRQVGLHGEGRFWHRFSRALQDKWFATSTWIQGSAAPQLVSNAVLWGAPQILESPSRKQPALNGETQVPGENVPLWYNVSASKSQLGRPGISLAACESKSLRVGRRFRRPAG